MLACIARYLDAGCDVISTDTWGLASAGAAGCGEHVHWMDLGRRGLRLARRASPRRPRGRRAVAFSLNGDVDSELGGRRAGCSARLFADESSRRI